MRHFLPSYTDIPGDYILAPSRCPGSRGTRSNGSPKHRPLRSGVAAESLWDQAARAHSRLGYRAGFQRTSPWSLVVALFLAFTATSRIFTTDQWAGYLIYHNYPQQRVFLDGRTNYYGPKMCSPDAALASLIDGERQESYAVCKASTIKYSGCGAAWLARLLGVQEVPGSNPGSPTKPLIELCKSCSNFLGTSLLLEKPDIPDI
jgi:hypothetical protein